MRKRLSIGAFDLAAWEAWFAIIILSIHSRPSPAKRTDKFAIATDGVELRRAGRPAMTAAPSLSG